jgi:hypothetical protein
MTEMDLLIDCLRRLNRAGVDSMLTGSMASNYWGIPRTTHDPDFVIQISDSDIPLVAGAFRKDFFLDVQSIVEAGEPPYQFNAIDARSALKVGFWRLSPDPFEREMFAGRLRVDVHGESAWLARAEDVILHKLVWNKITPSLRQLGDAAGVWLVQCGILDIAYLKSQAEKLGVDESLAAIMSGKVRPKAT